MSTRIIGIDGMTYGELDRQVAEGGHFVYYQYAISILIMTFRRGSDIFFIPAGEGRVAKGLPYSLLTFVAGWWGIPWGPIYSIGSLYTNFTGGKIVTDEVMVSLYPQETIPATRIEQAETSYTVPEEQ